MHQKLKIHNTLFDDMLFILGAFALLFSGIIFGFWWIRIYCKQILFFISTLILIFVLICH
jgi:hypothetical protein